MNAESLARVLQKTISTNKSELQFVEQFLEQALQSNPTEYIIALADILSNPDNNSVVRTAASLVFKGLFTAKDESLKAQCHQRWLSLPENARSYIKENAIRSIGTETQHFSAVAQCIALIACIELTLNKWPDLISILCNNVISTTSYPVKEVSLKAICFICQDVSPQFPMAQYSDLILTAVVYGMRKEIVDLHVKRAATSALLHSVQIYYANFKKENERNVIMEVVCEATQHTDLEIRVMALQSLSRIVTIYYHYMEPYMAQALFPITLQAIECNIEAVSLQGIEFWGNVSSQEVEISIENCEAASFGEAPMRSSLFYTKGALKYLVPALLGKLIKIADNREEDEWDPCEAASICLVQLASCCGEHLVALVMAFVITNIKNSDWRYRYASFTAFACILTGMKEMTMSILITAMLPAVIESMYDRVIIVKCAASWTIHRICECASELVIKETYLKILLETIVNGLKEKPQVASYMCKAISSLAEASTECSDEPYNTCLSPYFDSVVESLLETTLRNDGDESNLRSSAFEALIDLIRNSAINCYPSIQKITMAVLEKLNQQIKIILSTKPDKKDCEFLSFLCVTLQSLIPKIKPEDVPEISDQIIMMLLQMLRSETDMNYILHDDALLVISSLIDVLNREFLKYMEEFKQHLYQALKNNKAYRTCLSALCVVINLSHALKSSLVPYCDEIMTLMLENLKNRNAHPSLKPEILTAISEIVLCIGSNFVKYIEAIFTTLAQISPIEIDRKEYMYEFRLGIARTCTSIVHALNDEETLNPDLKLIEMHVPYMLKFLAKIGSCTYIQDELVRNCTVLIGELCIAFGAEIISHVDVQAVNNILKTARKSTMYDTRRIGRWATKKFRKLSKNS